MVMEYEHTTIKKLSGVEAVRRRPGMYFGEFQDFIRSIHVDAIEFCQAHSAILHFTILDENVFHFKIQSSIDYSLLIEGFNSSIETLLLERFLFCLRGLKFLSSNFELKEVKNDSLRICFSIDKTIMHDVDLQYYRLSDDINQLALLNRNFHFIIRDERSKFLNQNYFYFPNGIFHLFENCLRDSSEPKIKLQFNGVLANHELQIGLAYRSDWYPQEHIISFANDTRTVCGGSLVDGIISGIKKSIRHYIKHNQLSHYQYKKSKILNGLVVVCAIRGEGLNFKGSFKESLCDEAIKEDATILMYKIFSELLTSDTTLVDTFLLRFDSQHITSGLF